MSDRHQRRKTSARQPDVPAGAGSSQSAGSAELTPKTVWNGWTSNYRRRDDGYIIHACREDRPMHLVAICGSGKIMDTGMLTLAEGAIPGCIKCRKKLRKLGLLPPNY